MSQTVKGYPLNIPGPCTTFELELPKGSTPLGIRANTRGGMLELVALVDCEAKGSEVWALTSVREGDEYLPSSEPLGKMKFVGTAIQPNGLVDHFFGALSNTAKPAKKAKKADPAE